MSSPRSLLLALLLTRVMALVMPILLLVALLLPAPAIASPVNAEKLLNDPRDHGFSGSADVSVALQEGNVRRLSLGAGAGIQYWTLHPEGVGFGKRPVPPGVPPFFKDRWVLIANGQFVRVSLDDVANSGFGHMRYTRMWLPRLGSDVFTQAQYNAMTRLTRRLLAGLGLRVDPVHRRRLQIWAGTGYMTEFERNDVVPEDPHPARVINHRWTNYVVLQTQLWDSAVVARSTTYAQPRFDDFGDIRVLESIVLEARATPVFALGIEFEAQYDSRPPLVSGVLPLDLILTSYVRIGGPGSGKGKS
ncbi:DUF481 domain-containing protein [Paraliomyxa miuraensis]|uniref:DUF481 domain-containing protein n=1 Tax=Paraliomyxa miuraensis TaxID=376150 RepID=UPI00225C2447|nr:DUF481 domain-containing protein [Paraliomyxa miuraensis]MCX4242743.1 DUF481 domain-containing protein [Paraliomyxa miuraensis]